MRYDCLIRAFSVLAISVFCSCSMHPAVLSHHVKHNNLARELDSLFANPALENAFRGVIVKSLKTGEILYSHNPNKGFIPASNAKLFTTAAFLNEFGPGFRFTTKIFKNGSVSDDGMLDGDVVIRGSGDPTLASRYSPTFPANIFDQWADTLKMSGITRITGNIIGDDNYFGDEPLGQGWFWDDEAECFSAQISALSVFDNCIRIFFSPFDSASVDVPFRLAPETHYITIQNRLTTSQDTLSAIEINRERGQNLVKLTGAIRNDAASADSFSIENPTKFAATVFREALQAKGITVNGQAFDIDELTTFQYDSSASNCLASHRSIAAAEIIRITNQETVNLYAELLLRALGKKLCDKGESKAGIMALSKILKNMDVSGELLCFADGSGLSRLNLVTPQSIIELLSGMYKHEYRDYFINSLPVAGKSGTLKSRMKGTIAEGKVRAKTGNMRAVSCISGYTSTLEQEPVVFAILINSFAAAKDQVRQVQDKACELITAFLR